MGRSIPTALFIVVLTCALPASAAPKKSTKGAVKTKPAPQPPPATPEPEPEPAPEKPTPPPAPRVYSVGLTNLVAVSVPNEEAVLHSEALAQKLLSRGLKVQTPQDLSAVLGLERQRQLLGCGQESCIAELAAALGVDAMVLGQVGKIDGRYSLNVKLLETKGAQTVVSDAWANLSAAELSHALDRAAWHIVQALAERGAAGVKAPTELAPVVQQAAVSSGGAVRTLSIIPAVVGVGAGVAGVLCHLQAGAAYAAITPELTSEAAKLKVQDGTGWQNGERAAFIGAGVLLTGAALMFALGGPTETTPVVMLDGHGGGMVAVTGRFP